jgi:hypothetical protein
VVVGAVEVMQVTLALLETLEELGLQQTQLP